MKNTKNTIKEPEPLAAIFERMKDAASDYTPQSFEEEVCLLVHNDLNHPGPYLPNFRRFIFGKAWDGKEFFRWTSAVDLWNRIQEVQAQWKERVATAQRESASASAVVLAGQERILRERAAEQAKWDAGYTVIRTELDARAEEVQKEVVEQREKIRADARAIKTKEASGEFRAAKKAIAARVKVANAANTRKEPIKVSRRIEPSEKGNYFPELAAVLKEFDQPLSANVAAVMRERRRLKPEQKAALRKVLDARLRDIEVFAESLAA